MENIQNKDFPSIELPSGQPPEEYISRIRQPYANPTPGHLPLIGVGDTTTVANDGTIDHSPFFEESLLKIFDECGLNCIQFSMDDGPTSLRKSIENCEATGVRETVRMWGFNLSRVPVPRPPYTESSILYKQELDRLYKTEKEVAQEFQNRWTRAIPEVWKFKAANSYQLFDEPNQRYFKWAARTKDLILQTDKWDTLIFDNLLPIYASPQSLSGRGDGKLASGPDADLGRQMTYQDYLNEYLRIFNPAVWCFDCYCLEGTGKMDEPVKLRNRYFENLDLIRRQSNSSDAPFWSTVRCLFGPMKGRDDEGNPIAAYMPESEYSKLYQNNSELGLTASKHLPTLIASMKLESFCALAFGAKGLMFWSTINRPSGLYLWAPLFYDLTATAKNQIKFQMETGGADKYDKVREICSDKISYDYSLLHKSKLFSTLQWIVTEVKKREEYFLGAHVCDTWSTKNLPGTNSFSTQKTWIKLETSNFNGLITRLVNPKLGLEVMVVVNVDIKKSFDVAFTYTESSVKEVSGRDCGLLTIAGVTKYESTMESGDWRIFVKPTRL